MSFETFLGYFTGLYVFGGYLPYSSLLATTFFVHLLDAILCRLFARHNGYPQNLWMLMGFCLGVWALAMLLLLPKKKTV